MLVLWGTRIPWWEEIWAPHVGGTMCASWYLLGAPTSASKCRAGAVTGVLPYRRALLFPFHEDTMLTHTCKAWNHIGMWLSTSLWLFKQEMWTKADFQTMRHHTVQVDELVLITKRQLALFFNKPGQSLTISLCSRCVTSVDHVGVQHREWNLVPSL